MVIGESNVQGMLKFELPEERETFEQHLKGPAAHHALFELDQWLRSKLKYEELDEVTQKALQECRDKLHEECTDADVTIW